MKAYLPEIIFSIIMAGAIVLLVVVSRKRGKIWKPKDTRAIAIIKITCWAGLVTWMIFTLATSVVLARGAPVYILQLLGDTLNARILSWVIPVWIIFTTLMLIWAVVRFANNRLRRGVPQEEKTLKIKEEK